MQLTSIGKRYARGRWVLTDVDLDVSPGQLIAITGSNGAGKSTLLNIMAGITLPSVGTVTGRPRSIGYVPERFPVRTQLSAVGYLRHMGRIRGLSTGAATRRVAALVDRFALSGADGPLRQLSKGNAQRVALIQAMLVRPDLLILDEPGTGLDELGHDVLTEAVEDVARDGGAVVLGGPPLAGGPPGATVYELRGGRLTPGDHPTVETARAPAPTDGPAVRIVLRRGRDARELPAALARFLSTQPSGSDSVATVPTAISDRLLATALRNGWSVLSVLPQDADTASQDPAAQEQGDSPRGGSGPG